MSRDPISRAWASARFLIDGSPSPADDVLHVYCPGARDLPVEHLTTLALLPIHDWNSVLLQVAGEGPKSCLDRTSACVLAIDPFRRIRDVLLELRQSGYRWVTNFPSTEALDGQMRTTLDDLGFGLRKELQFVEDAATLGLGVVAFASSTGSAGLMVERGASALLTPDASLIDVARLPSAVPVIELAVHRP